MSKVVIVYDDSAQVGDRIKTILGNKSYGEMILKRQTMFGRLKKIVGGEASIVKIKDCGRIHLKEFAQDTVFLHLLSSSAIISVDEFKNLLSKIMYARNNFNIRGLDNCCHGAVLHGRDEYVRFLDEYISDGRIVGIPYKDTIESKAFVDLTDYDSLLMFISSGFDARYFNSLQGDSYTVTKKSADKKKMKKEYQYYWLLPESMKSWMVMPYNYAETKDWASYTMERMPMTDIAIRWTHGAVDARELENILDKTFYFFSNRAKKSVSEKEYENNRQELYVKKLDKRIADLKKMPEYRKLAQLIEVGTQYGNIDAIIEKYKKLYAEIYKKHRVTFESVIGHGDVFFANMLYSKELNFLRLIDPKGALTEDELWMDPYYDVAKLSHSVCGNYDFFNTGSYTIEYGKDMLFELKIHFDNGWAKEIFKRYLKKNGYDYALVRIYEASLFLSMLPLHIDNPHKVFGFILNAINILEELEENV